jgi:homocitrate synthase NifV
LEYVSVGLEDVSRADQDFALKAAGLAQDVGASRVRLSDSLGLLTPPATTALVATFKKELDIDLAVHCHDDFGMATGNAVTALASGADFADVSLLGIGERSGIAATEELAAYLTLKEKSHAYKIEDLRGLCHFVSQAAGVPIPRTKAIAGKDIFACESGLHAHALSKSPELFEPFDPGRIGADRMVAVGGKSGRAAVANALADNGLDLPEQGLPALVDEVRKLAWELERPLTDSELSKLVKN